MKVFVPWQVCITGIQYQLTYLLCIHFCWWRPHSNGSTWIFAASSATALGVAVDTDSPVLTFGEAPRRIALQIISRDSYCLPFSWERSEEEHWYRASDRVLCFGLNGAGSRHWTRSTRLPLRAKRLWLKLGKWEHRFWRLPPQSYIEEQHSHMSHMNSYDSYDLQPYYLPLPKGSIIHSAIPSFE